MQGRPPLPCVLFDLGGVLTSDPWESIVLTPDVGLADRLGMDRERARAIGTRLWARFSLQHTKETDYWSVFAASADTRIPEEMVQQATDATLVTNPQAQAALRLVRSRGFRIGIVTDNTSFWYPKQARLLDLDSWVDPDLVFLSFKAGVGKTSTPSLFDLASSAAGGALLIDDREVNLAVARRCGLRGRGYSMSLGLSLVDWVATELSDERGGDR